MTTTRRRTGPIAAAITALAATAALGASPSPAGAQTRPDTGSLQYSVGHAVAGSLGAGIPAAWLASVGMPLPSPGVGPGVTVEEGATWGAPRPRVDGTGPLDPGREPWYPPVFAGTQPHQWQSWTLIDPDTIRIRYTGAMPQCEGAAIRVVESDTAVTVALRTGLTPQTIAMPCPMAAVAYAATIDLRRPLGDRAVLDAAG